MSSPAPRSDAEDFLAGEMKRISASGDVTKRSAARLAIAAAIAKGVLPKGSLIPSEKRLTRILGISLGTVQAALQQLQQSSLIIRRRGDGSRVASREALGSETWHFRLLARDSADPLRITQVDLDVERTSGRGPWSGFFTDTDDFVLIRRRIIMSDHVPVGAEMILPRSFAPGLEDMPPDELRIVNIRPFLAEKFAILISRAEHRIDARTIHDPDAKRLNLANDTLAFEITAHAFLADDKPGYWQRIVAPCAHCSVTI